MKREEKRAQESQCRGSMSLCEAEVFQQDLKTTNELLILRSACLFMIVMRVRCRQFLILLKSGGTSLARACLHMKEKIKEELHSRHLQYQMLWKPEQQ